MVINDFHQKFKKVLQSLGTKILQNSVSFLCFPSPENFTPLVMMWISWTEHKNKLQNALCLQFPTCSHRVKNENKDGSLIFRFTHSNNTEFLEFWFIAFSNLNSEDGFLMMSVFSK